MTVPAPYAGAGPQFRLDVGLAQAAITELRGVHGQLVELRKQAVNLSRPERTAGDAVSADAFELLALKANGGPASFADAISAGLEHVEQLIVQMETEVEQQHQVDAEAARRTTRT